MKKMFVFLLSYLLLLNATAQIRLPKLISNGMVLQRDVPLTIWGWASPNEKVTLNLSNKKYKATTSSNGQWTIKLPAQKAGGPYEIKLTGKNELVISDVLFGDVWICSGQSNMVLPMERVKEKYPLDIANAYYPQIRNFFIPTTTHLQEAQQDLKDGSWKAANPTNVLQFGAVAYFFARKIYDQYKIPIGLINSSVGGTPVEAWTSEEGLKEFPDLNSTIQKNKDSNYINRINKTAEEGRVVRKSEDKGMNESIKWYEPNYIPKGWRTINIPGYWEDQGLNNLNGVVWYRKEIDLPAPWEGRSAKIFMGRIVDADEMYVNGKRIGNITYQYPPRRYDVPSGLLKTGKNIFTIRVTNSFAKGGFVPDKNYSLVSGDDNIDLKGTWQYKVGEVFTPQQPGPQGISAQNQPSALYNAMIAPLVKYSVKGYLWYQGESNTGNPGNYDKLLTALINDWRNKWNLPGAPFLFVQLANYMDYTFQPGASNWATLRNAQRKVLTVPNTGMVVTTDCGEWNDIHPLNKKDIGERLALQARKIAYNENIVASGPLFDRAETNSESITAYFKESGSGLIANDGEPLRYFAIAGADKKFVWAQAKIEGNKIIVWSTGLKNPRYVRYNWADNPDGNLYNKEGLPASAFENE